MDEIEFRAAFNSLAERMLRAGWLYGLGEGEGNVAGQWTDEGKRAVLEIRKILKALGHDIREVTPVEWSALITVLHDGRLPKSGN